MNRYAVIDDNGLCGIIRAERIHDARMIAGEAFARAVTVRYVCKDKPLTPSFGVEPTG